MKKFSTRGVVAVAMIAAMGISTPAIAFGASSSSASSSTHISLSSVAVARKEYWAAIKASKGSSDRAAARAAARAALTVSIANAMGARSTALVSLGAPPNPPANGADSAWIVSLHGINETYRLAVAAADAAFATAFPSATTAPERAVVRATLALAVANAEVARAAALVALGPPPAPTPTTTTTTVPSTTTTVPATTTTTTA